MLDISFSDLPNQTWVSFSSSVTNLAPHLAQRGILSARLRQQLEELDKPFFYDLSNLDQGAKIAIQLDSDLLIINVDKDRVYSESTFVFLLWMFFVYIISMNRIYRETSYFIVLKDILFDNLIP